MGAVAGIEAGTMTASEKAQIAASLASAPLGAGQAEGGLQAPFNASKQVVLVKVRNVSAVQERLCVIERISFARGGEQYESDRRRESKGREVIDLNALRAKAFFDDVSPKEMRKQPVDVALTFDSGMYVIPAYAEGHDGEAAHAAPWVEVPDGVYDLYVGNFHRLRDPRERAKELERVRSKRADFVIRPGSKNPAAFLEFERTVIEPKAMAVDMERVFAGDLQEV